LVRDDDDEKRLSCDGSNLDARTKVPDDDDHAQTNGKLERFYGVYDQKRRQFRSIDEYVH